MAVVVTDTRTVPTDGTNNADGDSTSGYSSPTAGETVNLFTADPSPIEATGHLGIAVSIETSDIVFTLSPAVDLSSSLIYVWVLANGSMDTQANGGIMLVLGDGTNEIGYHIAGSDVAAFRHDSGAVGYQCLIVDTAALPASFTAFAGAEGSLNLAALTQIGAGFKTLSKALGGASNCFLDIIRFGTDGLRITGGTSGDPGTFAEIAAEDRSIADAKAHGIIRELGAGLFGVQGPLNFGDNAGTAATHFEAKNEVVAWENRGLGTTRYVVRIEGNGTGSTTFQLGNKVGTIGGSDGCTLIVPAGIGGQLIASDADLQFCLLYGSVFAGFDAGVAFSADATNGPNHEVLGCTFQGCGQIDPGKVEFKGNAIINTTDANGGLLLDADGSANISDLSFTSDGTGHAIYITATGTYTFTRHSYTGYGADDTTDAVVFNDSGGAVTINVTDGDTPTVRNGAGASTTVNNNIAVTFSGMKDNTEVRVYTAGTTTELAGIENATDGTADDRSVTFSLAAGTLVDVRFMNQNWIVPDRNSILNFTWPNAAADIPITQVIDRTFDNPA